MNKIKKFLLHMRRRIKRDYRDGSGAETHARIYVTVRIYALFVRATPKSFELNLNAMNGS
jgi:hypothetical protein